MATVHGEWAFEYNRQMIVGPKATAADALQLLGEFLQQPDVVEHPPIAGKGGGFHVYMWESHDGWRANIVWLAKD